MKCYRFWRLVRGSSRSASRCAPRSVLGRLGLYPRSPDVFRELVVASRFYHYVKATAWQRFHSFVQAGDVQALAAASKLAMQAARYSSQY